MKKTGKLVELDWFLLQSKWELTYQYHCTHCSAIFQDWETKKMTMKPYLL